MPDTNKARIYKWDNINFFLIMSVVVGHMINYKTKLDPYDRACESLFGFIYCYHMPAFIFLSGLLTKRLSNDSPCNTNRIGIFLRAVLLLNIFNFVPRIFTKDLSSFDLLNTTGVSWYLCAMIVYLLVIYLFRKTNAVYLLVFSAVIGLLAGYSNQLTESFLSQCLNFMPFFLLGYVLDSDTVMNFLEHKAVKIGSVLFLILLAYICMRKPSIIHRYRSLLIGNRAFDTYKINIEFYHRFLVWGLQIVTGIAVMSVIPKQKLPLISVFGTRTLTVYLFHRGIIFYLTDLSQQYGWEEAIGHRPYLILLVLSAILLTVILSTKPIDTLQGILLGTRFQTKNNPKPKGL